MYAYFTADASSFAMQRDLTAVSVAGLGQLTSTAARAHVLVRARARADTDVRQHAER